MSPFEVAMQAGDQYAYMTAKYQNAAVADPRITEARHALAEAMLAHAQAHVTAFIALNTYPVRDDMKASLDREVRGMHA